MDPSVAKMKALTKEETGALISLIEESSIISNKSTNAITNKLKNDEWQLIADKFNATVATCRRTPQQLRLKWENLKKNSRKRSTLIRTNHNEAGGHNYIPPDDILDRVSAMLDGGMAEEFTIKFGSDAEPEICIVSSHSSRSSDMSVKGSTVDEDMLTDNNVNHSTGATIIDQNIFPSNSTPKPTGIKRKMGNSDDNKAARNLAIADYYITKKKLLESKLAYVSLEKELLASKLVCISLEKETLESKLDCIAVEKEILKYELEKIKSKD